MKLRHGGLGRRLGGSFLIFAILIIVAAGTGWWGLGQQHAAQRRIEHLELVKDDVQLVKYYVADITGWQGSDYRTVIAAAVEEQSVTTAEMNRTSPKRRPPPRSGVSRSQMSGELHAPVARFQL